MPLMITQVQIAQIPVSDWRWTYLPVAAVRDVEDVLGGDVTAVPVESQLQLGHGVELGAYNHPQTDIAYITHKPT